MALQAVLYILCYGSVQKVCLIRYFEWSLFDAFYHFKTKNETKERPGRAYVTDIGLLMEYGDNWGASSGEIDWGLGKHLGAKLDETSAEPWGVVQRFGDLYPAVDEVRLCMMMMYDEKSRVPILYGFGKKALHMSEVKLFLRI